MSVLFSPKKELTSIIPLFYGTGTLYNRDGREYLVKGFPVHVRDDGKRVHLACYFPMPFFRSARIELVGPEGVETGTQLGVETGTQLESMPSREGAPGGLD